MISEKDYLTLLDDLSEEQFQTFLKSLSDVPTKGACYKKDLLTEIDLKESISESIIMEENYFKYPFGTIVNDNPIYLGGGFYPLDHSSFAVARNIANNYKGNDKPKILDLCAAPGGKCIALSTILQPSLLVANDITYKRAEVLKLNIERSSIENAVVLSVVPKKLLEDFRGYFDIVILDAPCSGSGMSRKKEKMEEDWSWNKVSNLIPIQKDLIDISYELLKKGGLLSYSTCSYAKQEDEEVIEYILNRQDATVLHIPDDGSILCKNSLGRKYIPGLYDGEGQYQCILLKNEETDINELEAPIHEKSSSLSPSLKEITYKGIRRLYNSMDARLFKLNPLKIGFSINDNSEYAKCEYDWDLCHCSNIFENLALTLEQARQYIRGEDIRANTAQLENKLVIATYKNLPLGFAKGKQNRFRNYLPKSLRIH